MKLISTSYNTINLEDTVYFSVATPNDDGAIAPHPSYWQSQVNYQILYLPPPVQIPNTSTYEIIDTYRGEGWFSSGTSDNPLFIGNLDPRTFSVGLSVFAGTYEDPVWVCTGSYPAVISPGGYNWDDASYEYRVRNIVAYRKRRFRQYSITKGQALKPNYISLLEGYELDNRVVPSYPTIKPTEDKQVTISYYRENELEPLDLKSIDWMSYKVDLLKDKDCTLPIIKCVLGTLYCDDQQTLNQISGLTTSTNCYDWSDLLPSSISSLFIHWNSLHTASIVPLEIPSNAVKYNNVNEISRTLRTIGANNNCWNNRNGQTPDLNHSANHPMFEITGDFTKVFERYIQPQPDGSYGVLTMDSPRLIEIHKALNAQSWALNTTDPTKPRVDNLGWRINRLCEVLGIRVKPDGKPDEVLVKKKIRTVIDKTTKLDKDKIGVGNFGDDGMVVKRINNRFNGKEIVSDQCVILHDVIQLIQEYQDQSNLALGIQESSAIEVISGKNTGRFDNQLQLLIEMFNLLNTATDMQRSTLISSLVGQAQTSEIIAGLGLPSVTKTIPITINKKTSQLPYKGISPHRSISQEVATCTANVGIVLGQLL